MSKLGNFRFSIHFAHSKTILTRDGRSFVHKITTSRSRQHGSLYSFQEFILNANASNRRGGEAEAIEGEHGLRWVFHFATFNIDGQKTIQFKMDLFVILLKWYYDQRRHFWFSLDFETLFTKHFPSEILNLNFEMSFYLTANFRFNGPHLYTRKDTMTSFT